MTKSDDTTTAAGIWDEDKLSGRLGPKGRRWAAMWRAVHGARLGCYNAKRNHGKRGKKPGSYEAAKAGAVSVENRLQDRSLDLCSGPRVPFAQEYSRFSTPLAYRVSAAMVRPPPHGAWAHGDSAPSL